MTFDIWDVLWFGFWFFIGGFMLGLILSLIEYEKEKKAQDDLEHGCDGGEPELFVNNEDYFGD